MYFVLSSLIVGRYTDWKHIHRRNTRQEGELILLKQNGAFSNLRSCWHSFPAAALKSNLLWLFNYCFPFYNKITCTVGRYLRLFYQTTFSVTSCNLQGRSPRRICGYGQTDWTLTLTLLPMHGPQLKWRTSEVHPVTDHEDPEGRGGEVEV